MAIVSLISLLIYLGWLLIRRPVPGEKGKIRLIKFDLRAHPADLAGVSSMFLPEDINRLFHF